MPAINYYLVYMSPNGSTEKVADALAEQLTKGSATVERLDLAGVARSLEGFKDYTAKGYTVTDYVRWGS